MALTTCPDCGTEVSDQAPACIKCGRPMVYRTLDGGWRRGKSIVVAASLSAAIVALMVLPDWALGGLFFLSVVALCGSFVPPLRRALAERGYSPWAARGCLVAAFLAFPMAAAIRFPPDNVKEQPATVAVATAEVVPTATNAPVAYTRTKTVLIATRTVEPEPTATNTSVSVGVSDTEKAYGLDAICEATAVLATDALDRGTPPQIVLILAKANIAIQSRLGIETDRAAAILTATLKDLQHGDPEGNLLTTCMAWAEQKKSER
jgi:hypothetical protein